MSYINKDVLCDCLLSIRKYNDIGDDLEVIVVDNSPNMELFDEIKAKFNEVKVIKNENKGFGHGNNVGYQNATGKYLFFLNPDTILIEPIFHSILTVMEADSRVGMLGMKLLDVNRNENMSFHYLEEHTFLRAQLAKINNKRNNFKQDKMYICGADMVMRKKVFEEIGGFDENLFMYYEESDLTRRLHEKKYHNVFVHDLKLIHLEAASTANQKIKKETIERELDSYLYYCKKFNLNFKKFIKKKKRYAIFKKSLYQLRNSQAIEYYKVAIEVYNDYLKR